MPVIMVTPKEYKELEEMVKQGIKIEYPFEWYYPTKVLDN